MYKIIGADQKEYGPISADLLRQWISEGRINGQTRIQVIGTEAWKTVAETPEIASYLPASAPIPPAIVATPVPVSMPPALPASNTNQMAIWSLVTGIVSLFCCCFPWPFGIVAIVLGCIAHSKINQTRQNGAGMATAGIVLGVFGLIIGVIGAITAYTNPDLFRDLTNNLNQ